MLGIIMFVIWILSLATFARFPWVSMLDDLIQLFIRLFKYIKSIGLVVKAGVLGRPCDIDLQLDEFIYKIVARIEREDLDFNFESFERVVNLILDLLLGNYIGYGYMLAEFPFNYPSYDRNYKFAAKILLTIFKWVSFFYNILFGYQWSFILCFEVPISIIIIYRIIKSEQVKNKWRKYIIVLLLLFLNVVTKLLYIFAIYF